MHSPYRFWGLVTVFSFCLRPLLYSLFSRVWGFHENRIYICFSDKRRLGRIILNDDPVLGGRGPPTPSFQWNYPVQLGGRWKTKTRYFNTLKTAMGNSTPNPLKGTRILWDQTEMLQKNSLRRLFVYDIR